MGGAESIERLSNILAKDPKKYCHEPSSDHHRLNIANLQKQTPLYLASKNGYLEVVQFLID